MVALVAAAMTAAPSFAATLRLTALRAWQVAAAGAAGLAFFWVLFVLPAVGSNTSLLSTVGVAAGMFGAWIAPGRQSGNPYGPPPGPPRGPTW